MKIFFIILLMSLTRTSLAKRAPINLMPVSTTFSQESKSVPDKVATIARARASTPASSVRYNDYGSYGTSRSQFGIELGIVGRRQTTDADFMGMQSLIGARGFFWLPVYHAFTIKPSIGYFFKKETAGSVSVTQNHIEGGLGVLLTIVEAESAKWHIGISNRVTRSTSSSNVFSKSSTSPADLFFRSGPTTGILVRLGGALHLTADFEYTWSFERPTRTYMGLVSGLGFEL